MDVQQERRDYDLWFTEYQTRDLRLGLRIKRVLRNIQTAYQHLLVVETQQYGNLLALDGAIQITEADEFAYHEMMAHIPSCAHPSPKRALVVGGGDGGVIRELLKHDSIEEAVLVDIDPEVTRASRDFFPKVSKALDEDRVTLLTADALAYIKGQSGSFDIVVVDSTDPVDFAAGLFRAPFYRDVAKALRPEGIMIAQTESPFAEPELVQGAYRELSTVFPVTALCWGALPTYPTGMWTYAVGSKVLDPGEPRRTLPARSTRYYSSSVHRAAFVLPPFLSDMIRTSRE
ncbi:MAG: polyamine aminopropyltransferase [Synergistales bacterium]|nr:polyamine aminopropyltransferase [Synergistales bacterium]